MRSERNILMTGVTGSLGCQLLKLILADRTKKVNLFLLVRAQNESSARKRVQDAYHWISSTKHKDFLKNKNIKILVGDLTENNLGLNNRDYTSLTRSIDVVYHLAALTRFHDPIAMLRLANVTGTQRILDFISQSKTLVELNYVSTAFIAGNFKGKFKECDFDVGQKFNNPYEQSKFEAEKLIRKFYKNKKNVRIFRPSIIVGEYQTGAIADFQMFYKPLYLLSKEVFEEIPANRDTLFNLIPVDIAAKMIFLLANDEVHYDTNVYHIVSPNGFRILKLMDLSVNYFNFKKPKLFRSIIFKNKALQKLYKESVKPFFNYFIFNAKFECQETFRRLYKLDYYPPSIDDSFMKRIFDYTVKRKYIEINN